MKNALLTFVIVMLGTMMFSCQPVQQKTETTPIPADILKGNVEPYYFSTTLNGDFDTVVAKVTAALKTEGFGIISTIDVQKAFKEKLEVDYKKYLILGACNPNFAHQALNAEDKIGTMLPCNVVIQETGEQQYEVAAVNPVASMMAIDNPSLTEIAIQVKDKLQAVVEKLE